MTAPAATRAVRLLVAACFVSAFACISANARAGTLDAPPVAGAQDAPLAGSTPDASATPQPDATVRDPDFGVVARHFGLQRQVEMFQWRLRADGGYERAWSDVALDSSGFAPGHDNPPFPLRNRQWLAKEVRVDGLPLDPAVVSALGEWVPFRPSFSALPGNLAATFQPQGDGLGTAEDPMAPRVGDLRIHWRELRLPPLRGRIVADGGRWRLDEAASVAAAARAGDGDVATQRPLIGRLGIGLLVAFLVVFAIGFGVGRLLRRRR